MSGVLKRLGLRRMESALAPLVEELPPVVASPKQNELAKAVFSGVYRYILFGGAIRGGKTFGALMIFFILMKLYPRSRWAIVRKDLPTIRRNFLPTFEKLRPKSFCGAMNYTTWEATALNGSKLIIMPESIKEDPDLNRFKGLEVNGFFGEEVNELQEVTHYKMAERAGTWIIPDSQESYEEEFLDGYGKPTGRKTGRIITRNIKAIQPAPINVYTCNPDMNWVYTLFYEPFERGELKAPYQFIPALPSDNPHNPVGLIENLEQVLPEEAVNRFIKGDWHVADKPDQLIKTEWIFNALNNVEPSDEPSVRYGAIPATIPAIGADVSRYGKDNTVFAYVYRNTLYKLELFPKQSTMRTSSLLRLRASEWPKLYDDDGQVITVLGTPGNNCRIDGVGIGSGIVDDCLERGFEVVEIIAGAKAVYPRTETHRDNRATGGQPRTGVKRNESLPTAIHPQARAFGEETREMVMQAFPWRFKDLRSQMWWMFARRLEAGLFAINLDDESKKLLPKLIQDLTTPEVHIDNDKEIRVESKDDIFDRLKRSTDFGDPVVMAAFELPVVSKRPPIAPSGTIRSY